MVPHTTYHEDRVHPTTYHESRIHLVAPHINDRAFHDPEHNADSVQVLAYPINKISYEVYSETQQCF